MNIGLVHAVIHDNDKDAIKQLDDCFEENDLSRCEKEFKVYFSLNIEDIVKPKFRKFNSAAAAKAFIDALVTIPELINEWYFLGDETKFIIASSYKEWKDKYNKLYPVPKEDFDDSFSNLLVNMAGPDHDDYDITRHLLNGISNKW